MCSLVPRLLKIAWKPQKRTTIPTVTVKFELSLALRSRLDKLQENPKRPKKRGAKPRAKLSWNFIRFDFELTWELLRTGFFERGIPGGIPQNEFESIYQD